MFMDIDEECFHSFELDAIEALKLLEINPPDFPTLDPDTTNSVSGELKKLNINPFWITTFSRVPLKKLPIAVLIKHKTLLVIYLMSC